MDFEKVRIDENTQITFFALLRAGLWESLKFKGESLKFKDSAVVDWEAVRKLAEEQSVVGLVAAGIECFKIQNSGFKIPKAEALQFIGQTMLIEQQNRAMNEFISELMPKLEEAGIRAVLVKGQGVAQCYERPDWRSCGDVDLFLDRKNYERAKTFLTPLAEHVDDEDTMRLHLGMTIDSWVVELHGTLRGNLSKRINDVIDDVQRDIFEKGGVRTWRNGEAEVLLPNPDNDIIIVFTHFIGHFYVGGIGLRQICDWSRLLWSYRSEIDVNLLEKRLRAMGLMSEWKAFATIAVKRLGMSEEAMPLYPSEIRWDRKAGKICRLILKTGNFGHNKDESYRSRFTGLLGNLITFFRRLGEFARLGLIFPKNAPRFFVTYTANRAKH